MNRVLLTKVFVGSEWGWAVVQILFPQKQATGRPSVFIL